MASLSASTDDAVPEDRIAEQGHPGAARRVERLLEVARHRSVAVRRGGDLLMILTRGSVAYLLSTRSLRATVLLVLARTSTWASSDISQDRKFHAWSVTLESLEMPMPSPPMKVDWPPLTPGIGVDADLDGLVRGGEQRRRVRHHADLALLEVADPGGAGLLLGGRVRPHRPSLQLTPHRVDLLGRRAVEVRGGARPRSSAPRRWPRSSGTR